jgi:hypothetical protein
MKKNVNESIEMLLEHNNIVLRNFEPSIFRYCKINMLCNPFKFIVEDLLNFFT